MIGTAHRALLATFILAATLAADNRRDAFGVAVVRRDGIAIPFAAFDGRAWRNAWPGPQAELTVPINLDSVPKRWWGPTGPLELWQLWPTAGSPPQTLHVVQPDWVDIHCARHIALKTDYRPPTAAPPAFEQPYPKDGLAVSPPRAITAVEILAPESQESRTLMPTLLEAFNQAEREVASHFNHPVIRRGREGIEPTIEAVYAFGDAPRYFYVEASRSYQAAGHPGECIAFAFGTGWFIRDGEKTKSLLTLVDLLRCDRLGATYMLPLGVVRVNDRLFWIAQFSGWKHERYVVVELKPKAVELVVNTWGGAC
jgi:hypothetical protein